MFKNKYIKFFSCTFIFALALIISACGKKVNQADVTITNKNTLEDTIYYVGETIEVNADGGSGSGVYCYAISNNAGTFEDNILTITKAGVHEVTVYRAGDKKHKDSMQANVNIKVQGEINSNIVQEVATASNALLNYDVNFDGIVTGGDNRPWLNEVYADDFYVGLLNFYEEEVTQFTVNNINYLIGGGNYCQVTTRDNKVFFMKPYLVKNNKLYVATVLLGTEAKDGDINLEVNNKTYKVKVVNASTLTVQSMALYGGSGTEIALQQTAGTYTATISKDANQYIKLQFDELGDDVKFITKAKTTPYGSGAYWNYAISREVPTRANTYYFYFVNPYLYSFDSFNFELSVHVCGVGTVNYNFAFTWAE